MMTALPPEYIVVGSTCRFNGLTGVVTRVVLVIKINPTQHGLASRVSKETTQDSGGKIANCVYCIQLSSDTGAAIR